MSNYEEMMATAIETKHRQLCLARKGLYKVIVNSITMKVTPGETTKELEEKANFSLDEIIRSAVAVDLMQKEFDEMQRFADKITHEVNTSKSFFERIFKDEKKDESKKDL